MNIRSSAAYQALTSGVEVAGHIIVGVFLLLGGAAGAAYLLEHPPIIKPLVYLFVIIALFGALLLPGILVMTKQIVVFVQPYLQNVPVFGQVFGRRDGDVPKAPVVVAPVTPEIKP